MLNGNGPFDSKVERMRLEKRPGLSVVVTVLEKDGTRYIDIREQVDDPEPREDGSRWDGWTKRGITMPEKVYRQILAVELSDLAVVVGT